MSDEKKARKKRSSYYRAIFIGVVALWLLALSILMKSGWTFAERGQLGDQFGSLSALFSGLAFAGIIVSLWMQRDELKMQRRELQLQREELRLTREVMVEQREEMERNRELQAQPIVDFMLFTFLIHPPRLLWNEESKEYQAHSPVSMTFDFQNMTSHSTIDVFGDVGIFIGALDGPTVLGRRLFYAAIRYEKTPANPNVGNLEISSGSEALFETLQTRGGLVTIHARITYRNLLGIHFYTDKTIHLFLSNEEREQLKWRGWRAQFENWRSENATWLKEQGERWESDRDKWQEQHDVVIRKGIKGLTTNVIGVDQKVIPGFFDAKVMSDEEYQQEVHRRRDLPQASLKN